MILLPFMILVILLVALCYLCNLIRHEGIRLNFAPKLLWENAFRPISSFLQEGYNVISPKFRHFSASFNLSEFATVPLYGTFNDEDEH